MSELTIRSDLDRARHTVTAVQINAFDRRVPSEFVERPINAEIALQTNEKMDEHHAQETPFKP